MGIGISDDRTNVSFDHLTIRRASEGDLEDVIELLKRSDLPVAGIAGHHLRYVVALEGERLIGCVGAEVYGELALIRSLAVAEDRQGTGLGRRLVREILDRLTFRGIREFYLLTTTAEKFFSARGFETVPRSSLPDVLQGSEELRGACPATATSMRLIFS